jgi:outer membrane protein insertion porin family
MKHFVGLIRRTAGSLLLATGLIFLSCLSAFAQAGGPAVVRSVEVQYVGPQTISKERVLSQIRTKVGQPYSDAVVEQDIRGLYATGQVQNVRIFGQPVENGVKVMVVIQTRALVNEIEIEGADRIPARKIRKKINLKINAALSEEQLEKGRQDIIDMYKARGFNDVDVKYRVDMNEARGTSRAVFTINEGTKGAIGVVRFEGNTHFSERVLRKQMKTKGKTILSFVDKSGRLDEAQLQQDLNSVREWYQNHGYIDVEVKEAQRAHVGNRMELVISIVEGPQYHVGKLAIAGQKATSSDKIYALLR